MLGATCSLRAISRQIPVGDEPYVATSQTASSMELGSVGSRYQKNLDRDCESGVIFKLLYAVLISVVIAKAKLKNLSNTRLEQFNMLGPFVAKRLNEPLLCGKLKFEVGRIFL